MADLGGCFFAEVEAQGLVFAAGLLDRGIWAMDAVPLAAGEVKSTPFIDPIFAARCSVLAGNPECQGGLKMLPDGRRIL